LLIKVDMEKGTEVILRPQYYRGNGDNLCLIPAGMGTKCTVIPRGWVYG